MPGNDWDDDKIRILDPADRQKYEDQLESIMTHELVHAAQRETDVGTLASELEAFDFHKKYENENGLNYKTNNDSDSDIAGEYGIKKDNSTNFQALDASKTQSYRDRAKKAVGSMK